MIGMLASVSISLLVAGIYHFTGPSLVTQLAEQLGIEKAALELDQTLFDRRIRPAIKGLAHHFGFLREFTNPKEIEEKLAYAGHPFDLNAEQFFGLQILAALVSFVFGIYYTILGLCGGPIVLTMLPLAGFFLPNWWLNQQVDKRQRQITLALPDMLDLLSVCVQAGMGFDAALRNIAQRMKGPLGEEINRLLLELHMGEPRTEALERLVKRNKSEELRRFIGALVQAQELGVPVATALEIQAEEMRARRTDKAKELAAKASPKISLVAIFIVAPSALLLMLCAFILGFLLGPTARGLGGIFSP
jgi:tight adherence protein C